MLFSSPVFLFQFLPSALLIYFAIFWATRKQLLWNYALVVISVAFYFIGNGALVLLLLTSIVANYFVGRWLTTLDDRRRGVALAIGVAFNLVLLGYFKYSSFFVSNIESLISLIDKGPPVPVLSVALPVGISFYTFMSISYLIQIYEGLPPAESFVDYAVYLSLFPHLVAGPIVRFSELRAEIAKRQVSNDLFIDGIFRFSIGLARKVIIADSLATQADRIFALPTTNLPTSVAWLGALLYAFQIFFDFSGYSDMAIGLAKMLGFHFPENFNQPYRAANVTEFWRRWHMTLTRWFRDYLYIPLGGNRRGPIRTYLNLFAVFLLCGLWHGAAWTFVAWGAYHGILLVAERLLWGSFAFRMRGPLGVFVTFSLVTIGWVLFRSTTIGGSFQYLYAMFHFDSSQISVSTSLLPYLSTSTMCYLALAAFFAFVPPTMLERFPKGLGPQLLKGTLALASLILSVAYISESTFRPFIYFRF